MENVNKKLKAIYFHWAINYQGPFPRSLSDTFEEYLELERYEYLGDPLWCEKILAECDMVDMAEFYLQIILIEDQYRIYSEQQKKKRERRIDKAWRFYSAECKRMGVPTF